jgi:hypothetical protein
MATAVFIHFMGDNTKHRAQRAGGVTMLVA